MTDDLKIAIISLDIKQENPAENFIALENALDSLQQGVDIVVLPELFSTVFISNQDKLNTLAENTTGNTITRLHQLADKYNLAIAGSYLCKLASTILNRAFFIEPGGDDSYYDKKHLFSLSPEKKLLYSGLNRCRTIRYRGWNISMIICYDLRFPVWCRNIKNDYDLLLVPANWPKVRSFAWKHLLIARAIENQAYIAGANRSGEDKYGEYSDLSYIFDPTGKNIGENTDNIVYATLSKKSIEDIRTKLPVINDADNFTINNL